MAFGFPIFVELTGKRCLVVGDRWAVDEKARALAEAGANVTVLAPHEYTEPALDGCFMVIAICRDTPLNHRIWADAEARNILVNALDDPPHCRFIFPAIHRQGELTVAISTAGKSPALAVRIRDWLAGELGTEYARFIELAGGLRDELKRRFPSFEKRKEIWYRLVDSPALALLRAGEENTAREALGRVLDEAEAEEVTCVRQ